MVEAKIKIGKGRDGNTLFMTEEEILSAAITPAISKSKLTAQQWAKIRKLAKKIAMS